MSINLNTNTNDLKDLTFNFDKLNLQEHVNRNEIDCLIAVDELIGSFDRVFDTSLTVSNS